MSGQQQRQQSRPSRQARGYGVEWEAARADHLSRHPLCVRCGRAGRVVAATTVDHVVPHRGDQALFWSQTNWQSLCTPCHSRKTALEDGRWGSGADLPPWPDRVRAAIHVVCGPSTEASVAHALQGRPALLIEPHRLIAEADGSALYESTPDRRRRGQVERNRLIRAACDGEWETVAIVVGAPKIYQRRHWAQHAAVTVVAPSLDVCLAHVLADQHAGKGWREMAARAWWETYALDPGEAVVSH